MNYVTRCYGIYTPQENCFHEAVQAWVLLTCLGSLGSRLCSRFCSWSISSWAWFLSAFSLSSCFSIASISPLISPSLCILLWSSCLSWSFSASQIYEQINRYINELKMNLNVDSAIKFYLDQRKSYWLSSTALLEAFLFLKAMHRRCLEGNISPVSEKLSLLAAGDLHWL